MAPCCPVCSTRTTRSMCSSTFSVEAGGTRCPQPVLDSAQRGRRCPRIRRMPVSPSPARTQGSAPFLEPPGDVPHRPAERPSGAAPEQARAARPSPGHRSSSRSPRGAERPETPSAHPGRGRAGAAPAPLRPLRLCRSRPGLLPDEESINIEGCAWYRLLFSLGHRSQR
jgi:hypothetical protein